MMSVKIEIFVDFLSENTCSFGSPNRQRTYTRVDSVDYTTIRFSVTLRVVLKKNCNFNFEDYLWFCMFLGHHRHGSRDTRWQTTTCFIPPLNFTSNSFVSSFMFFSPGRSRLYARPYRRNALARCRNAKHNNLFKPVTLSTVHDFLGQTWR